MYVVWVLVAMLALSGAYAVFDSELLQASPNLQSVSLAQSMSEYRQALVAYSLSYPNAQGSVSSAALKPFLSPYAVNPLWQTYIIRNNGSQGTPNNANHGSTVVVYTTSSAAAVAISGIEQLSQGSALAGVASQGYVVSPGNPAVPLPAALATSIPSGTPVWIAEAY